MIKKFLIVPIIAFSCLMTLSLNGAVSHKEGLTRDTLAYYPPQIKHVIAMIHQSTEARLLIGQVQKKGSIKIKLNTTYSQQFEALWEGTSRTILINPSQHHSEGSLIRSILFEMHNASTDETLSRLIALASAGKIDKESYVEQMERMEYTNALHMAELIDKGIRRGVFPKDAQGDLYNNFDDHYRVQQICGHSTWIADYYDSICPKSKRTPYRGTIPNLAKMTPQDKEDMLRYLAIKDALASKDPTVVTNAKRVLQAELRRTNRTLEDHSRTARTRTQQQRYLLQIIFKDNQTLERIANT